MRRTKLYLFVVSLTAALASPRAAEAQLSDTEWVKPMMMLLVDTSGSMERRIDELGQPTDCLPECSGPADRRKNRWALTVEALTGTFSSFSCSAENRTGAKYSGQYDENYFIQHYNLEPAFASQASDGILDTYIDNAKFGLMTFDGVATTTAGDTLVPYSAYPGNKASIDGQAGMWSYPAETIATASNLSDTPQGQFGWKPLAFPGCTVAGGYGVNAGVVGPDPNNVAVTETTGRAGAMISIGLDESSTAINSVNKKIQNSLRYIRPYGGTPIAAMLDDFRYYLLNNGDVKKGSDPFYQCRKRYAVLLTDGAPDSMFRDSRFQCGNVNDPTCPEITPGVRRCQCPYDTEVNLATNLVKNDGLEKLWVVAFNVDSTALNSLNQIAQAGGKQDALTANTGAELVSALSAVMALARPESTSRSVPVVVNTGRPVTLKGAQYVITAGFQVGAKETDPWQGRLFRQRVECNGTVPVSQDLAQSKGDLFHLTLNGRETGGGATRSIKTLALASTSSKNGNLYAGAAISPITSTVNLVRAVVGGVLDSLSLTQLTTLLFGLTAPVSEYNVPLTDFSKTLSPLNFDTIDTTQRDLIVDYTRGNTATRKDAKLADIYRSNPAVIPPLAVGSDYLNAFDPSLRSYYLSLATTGGSSRYGAAGRPGVVFVGTNDGVLHAFNLDTWTDKSGASYEAGYEFWGFVPPALFSKMYTGTQGHSTMFDGSPVVKDVILHPSATNKMGTVLVSAIRGANAYIALDVTYPEAPAFLWQRTFQTLGETVATPAIAHVKVNFQNSLQTRAVAILPGGRGTTSSDTATCDVDQYSRGTVPNGGRTKVRCWNTVGRGLWVVDVETGALIQEFDFRHFPSPMTGSVAVDGQDLGLTRAAYMTDEDGVLWRLSMLNSDGDPSKWRIAPIWDVFAGTLPNWSGVQTAVVGTTAFAGRVSTRPPVLLRDPKTANLSIIVGTGDIDYLLDSRPNRVVSLQETRKVDSTGELAESGSGTMKLNWGIQLDAYESVTGPISVLDDVAYFTTFSGPTDSSKCLVGGARIVGAAARDSTSSGLPLGKLVPESGVAGTRVLWYQPTEAKNALLLGLNVSPDPVCVAGTSTSDPLAAGTNLRVDNITSVSRGNYQLRTMVAGQGGSVMAGSNAGGAGAQRALTRSIPSPNVARSVGWASSIE